MKASRWSDELGHDCSVSDDDARHSQSIGPRRASSPSGNFDLAYYHMRLSKPAEGHREARVDVRWGDLVYAFESVAG